MSAMTAEKKKLRESIKRIFGTMSSVGGAVTLGAVAGSPTLPLHAVGILGAMGGIGAMFSKQSAQNPAPPAVIEQVQTQTADPAIMAEQAAHKAWLDAGCPTTEARETAPIAKIKKKAFNPNAAAGVT